MDSLNRQQREAVDAQGHTVIVACPGSGKTRVLVERATALSNRRPNAHIILVTFTRQAAAELRKRLEQKVASLARLRVSTFHSLALQQLLSNKDARICGPSEQVALLRRAAAGTLSDNHFSAFRDAVDAYTSGLSSALDNADFQKAYDDYLELLAQHSAIDFGQGILKATEQMEAGSLLPFPCDHLLVDEVQDIDPTQIRWINAHTDAGAELTVVGDDDQAIYSFRFSRGYAGMSELRHRHSATLITLSTNYRSRAEILGLAKVLISVNGNRVPKDLYSARGAGGVVRLHQHYWTDEQEAHAIATAIQTAPGPWAVIARSNYKLDLIAAVFAEREIEFSRPGRSGFWESEEPSLFLSLFSPRGLSDPLTRSAIATRAGASSPEAYARTKAYRELEGLLAKFNASGDPNPRIESIARWLSANVGGIQKKRRDSIIQVVELCQRYLTAMKGDCCQRTNQANRPKSTKEHPVLLLTCHGAKGREFPSVWIAACQDGVLPSNRADDIAEERRLLYVAMTRAEDVLHMSFAWNQVVSRQGMTFLRKLAPSRFLSVDMQLPIIERRTAELAATPSLAG